MPDRFDVAVIGAGAAGMMCAAVAGQRGRSVVLLDHAPKLAEKIRISGGGRCNFTNRDVRAEHFVSADPLRGADPGALHAARLRRARRDASRLAGTRSTAASSSATTRASASSTSSSPSATPATCTGADRSASRTSTRVGDAFHVATDGGSVAATRVVIATGGLSIPKIGATDFAYRIARRFGIAVVEPRPGLVPLTFADWKPYAALAGVALEVDIASAAGARFREDLLFTHRGLSGPAILQISNTWRARRSARDRPRADGRPGARARGAEGDVAPEPVDRPRRSSAAPTRGRLAGAAGHRRPAHRRGLEREARRARGRLQELATGSRRHRGLREGRGDGGRRRHGRVVAGRPRGAARPGLHFVGEAVDVTGWLGGYNFQWAWASGFAAGRAV